MGSQELFVKLIFRPLLVDFTRFGPAGWAKMLVLGAEHLLAAQKVPSALIRRKKVQLQVGQLACVVHAGN